MRRTVLLILSSLASLCLHAQTKENTEQIKVNLAVTKFFDGIAAVDAEMMK